MNFRVKIFAFCICLYPHGSALRVPHKSSSLMREHFSNYFEYF